MTSSQDYRRQYERFYAEMRNYLWTVKTLTILADLEEAIYDAFVDTDRIKNNLKKLESAIKDTMKDDEMLSKAFNELKEINEEDNGNHYLLLHQVEEVDRDENKQI